MSRPKNPIPLLRKHAPTEQWYFYANGKRTYLGSDRERAEIEYRAHVARLAGGQAQTSAPRPAGDGVTVGELLLEFFRRVTPDYPERRARDRILATVRNLSAFAGEDVADQFRPQRLVEFRRYLTDELARPDGKPLSRVYVNYQIGIAKWIWAWGAENDYVSAESACKLKLVRPLRKGKGGAERPRVAPVEEWQIDAVIPELHPIVAAMVRLQQWTGCRPGELCRMRRRDLSTSPAEPVPIPETKLSAVAADGVWFYVPESHKNTSRGKARVIAIGERGQEVLTPFLHGLKPDDVVFSPARAATTFLERNGRSTEHLANVKHQATYGRLSYALPITRAIRRINRERIAAGRLLLVGEAGLIPHWSPGQIRHTTATAVRARFGREDAAEYLGHAGLDMIDRYAEQAIETATKIAKAMG